MYKIQVKIGGRWVEMQKCNLENVSITKAIENGYIFARQNVTGSITFYSDDFNTLFDNITSIQLEAQIYRTEPSATGVVSGYLNLYGNWDFDRKVCELQFNAVDEYTELFENWDELPIFTVYWYPVTVQMTSETKALTLPASLIPGTGTEHNWVYIGQTPGYKHYVKQVIDLPTPLWDCDEALPTETSTIYENGEYVFPVYAAKYSKASQSTQTVIRTVENFTPIFEYLTEYLADLDIDITEETYCNYFNSHGLNNLMLAQKSKVLDNDAIASSKAPTLKQIFEIFKTLFNVDWKIENEEIVFKHPSEITQTTPSFTDYPKHDLTNYNGVSFSEQKNAMIFKTDELPFKEVWAVENTGDQDFDGLPIRYSSGISKELIEYDSTQFQRNIKAVLIAGDAESVRKEDISDDGFVIVACDADRKVLSETGIIHGQELINGKLAMSYLHYHHHRTGGRYFTSGLMNDISTNFTNIRKKMELTVNVPAFITDFSFDHLVKTGFGNMKIMSVTEHCNGQFTELKLEY